MRILELIGQALRPVRSDASKLVEASPAVASKPQTIIVASPVFENGASIPKDYSADGAGKFPSLTWTGVPSECQSLVLVIEDPDAPKPSPFVHGIFYNIPPDLQEINETTVLPQGITSELVERGVKMGTNTISKPVYMPPTPPPGHGPHHYHFQFLALDTVLSYSKEPTLSDIKKAIEGHVVASGELIGIYER